MRRRLLVVVAVVIAVVVVGGIALAEGMGVRRPGGFTYSVLERPQSDDDRTAAAGYTGDSSQVSLDTARLLATDVLGNQYFAVRDALQSCLVVVESAEESSGACNPRQNDASDILWLKVGDENGARLAIMVPDGYSGTGIRSAERHLVDAPNLVVLQSSVSEDDVVTIPGLGGRRALVVDTAWG
ncbi:MAG: hypothetical protein FWD75_07300 [Propionibacteriaceae bacterium]|nr:hypothetical protein [Propionibacteriaceae bacterium]